MNKHRMAGCFHLLIVALLLLFIGTCNDSLGSEVMAPQVRDALMPPPRFKPAVGSPITFRCRVRLGEQTTAGYVAAQITIDAVGTFPTDRNFVFQFQGVDDAVSPPSRNLIVDVPVSVDQGTQSTTVVRYLPRWAITQAVTVSVIENGRKVPGYQAGITHPLPPDRFAYFQSYYQYSKITQIADQWGPELGFDPLLIVGSNEGSSAANAGMSESEKSTATILGQLTQKEVSVHPVDQLATDWRAYTRFDSIVLSSQRLASVAKEERARDAIGQWVMMGGTLVVMGAEPGVSPIEKLGLSTTQDWVPDHTPDDWDHRISYERAAAGRVFGLPETLPDGGPDLADWKVFRQIMGYRVAPMLRRGVEPMMGDLRFRELLIRGVAQPPVYTFMGLLTAFVILVGPVAYRQTSRHRRSHLMFVIAPALALITTAMMFAYGIVSDGFGTSARIRQLTFVDGMSESGVDRIRATYFAGIRPADGLRFGGTDEVMVYPESQGQSWDDRQKDSPKIMGRVTVTQDEQRFDSSFLPSRRQTQFVVHRPRPNLGAVEFQINDAGEAWVTNGFDFPLRRMVIRDPQGKHWRVEQIGVGVTDRAMAADEKKVSEAIGSLYTEFRAIRGTSEASNRTRNSSEVYDLLRAMMQTVDPQRSNMDGCFEADLRDLLQGQGEIPPGYFVAISSVSDDASAVDAVEQVDCIRYVLGSYQVADKKDEGDGL